jgi:hypothetical protein
MSNKPSLFRSALNSLIDARTRQATRYVNGALLMLDDETLAANGYNRETLKKNASAPHFI